MSPPATDDNRLLRVVVWVVMLGGVAHLALVPLAETDLFFHLKLGQLIVERGAIPFVNLFSFTYPAYPDPDLSWGFQVLVATVFRIGGFGGIVILKTACIVTAAGLMAWSARRAGAGVLPTALAILVAAITAEPRMVERPHLVTFVGLGVLSWLLVEHERGRRTLGWVPLVTLVWANFHAGVFLAPLVLVLYSIGARLDRRPTRAAWLAALGAGLTMFVTPAGMRLPAYLLWHTGLGATRIIDEFRVADAWNDPWFFVMIGGCLLSLLGAARTIGWRRVLPLLVVGILAWRSVRFVAEWALLAAPTLALGLEVLGRGAGRLVRRPQAWRRGLSVGLVVVVVVVVVGARRRQAWGVGPLGLAADIVPFRAIEFVTREGLRERLYEDLDVGCYLLWEGWPRYQVFQDARLPAYPDSFHRALDQTPLAPAAFDALLRRHGVDTALISDVGVNMRAGSFDPEEWALVYRDRQAVVFVRRLPAFAAVIERYELPLRLRFAFDRGSWVEAILRPPARSSLSSCDWRRRLGQTLDELGEPDHALRVRELALESPGCLRSDEEAEVRYRVGARLQLAGRAAEAQTHYDRALSLRPADARVLANRGFLRWSTDRKSARADLERALALDPQRRDVRRQLETKD